MSDLQKHPHESMDSEGDPPSKRPCTIETPPTGMTPDDGSDFYSTPLSAVGTPVTKQSSALNITVTQAIEPVKPTPVIPGLGLVNNPDASNGETQQDSLVSQDGPESSLQTKDIDISIDHEVKEPVSEQKPSAEGHDQIEPTAAPHDAMEVDQNLEPNDPQGASGEGAPQADNQDQDEEEHPEWEVDSSPYESSTDSSSDSDESDDEDYPILSADEQARILMLAEGGSDDEGEGKGKAGGLIRSTNEVDYGVLPIPDVTITPEMKIVLLGKIQTVIENAVLIEASTSGEYQVLESGSLLCSEDRKVLGVVAETLGRVENPMYTVMYQNAADVQERGLFKDMPVYYVEAQSTFVFTQPLKGMKGSDASNFHDEEVAEEEIEFSDDEAEAEYKRKLKQKRQERKDARDGGASRGRKGPPGPSRLSHTELNYDDERGEDGYTPLARPKNLHEMMGGHEAPVEGNERGPSFRGGKRGRGRGSDRGRGGRGRGGGGRGSWERDQDHRSQQQQGDPSNYGQAATQSQGSHGHPPYQPQQHAYGMPQPFPGYPQYLAQPQDQFTPGAAPTQFPFAFPFQQAFAQPGSFQGIAPGAHVNPLFLAALQQQQYQQPPQGQHSPGQGQQSNSSMNFDQVQAQLDLLRNLSNQNQGPPPS